MTCPRCRTELGEASACTECGMRFLRHVTGIIKTSAVLISTRDDEGFYGSLREVPLQLRTRLEEATSGQNSGTILIADKGGRERILARAAEIQRQPELVEPAKPESKPPVWAIWAGALLLVIAALIIALVWGKWPNG